MLLAERKCVPSIDEDAFRGIMSRLVSGVSVVTVRHRNLDLAMTATSLVSVSLDPPTVLFTVHEDARLAEAVESGAAWAVSILGPEGLAAADWLASPGRPAINQLASVAHSYGNVTGAAILKDATAWIECETSWVKAASSHLVVVGTVRAGNIRPEITGGIVHAYGRLEQFGVNGEM